MLSLAHLTMWLFMLCLGLWFGYSPAAELRLGDETFVFVLVALAAAVVIAAFAFRNLYPSLLGWSKLLAVSAIASVFCVAAVAYATDYFECSYSCLGLVNVALGYACGEWSRGCVAEWFSVFFIGLGVVLCKFSRLSPNLSVNRICRKRQSGYLQR